MICFSTVQISLSSSSELALSASSPSFSRQAKRASGGTALGSYPNALCFTYSLVLSPHFRALAWIFFLLHCRHTDGNAYIFPHTHLSFRGIGGCAPKESADSGCDGDFCGTQSPCLLYHRTPPQGIEKSGCQIPRFQRISTLHDTEIRFLSLGVHPVFAPKWLCFCCKYGDLSHISAFWLSRTFQGHPAHSFHFQFAAPRSARVVPAQKQKMPQQTTPPAIPPV